MQSKAKKLHPIHWVSGRNFCASSLNSFSFRYLWKMLFSYYAFAWHTQKLRGSFQKVSSQEVFNMLLPTISPFYHWTQVLFLLLQPKKRTNFYLELPASHQILKGSLLAANPSRAERPKPQSCATAASSHPPDSIWEIILNIWGGRRQIASPNPRALYSRVPTPSDRPT